MEESDLDREEGRYLYSWLFVAVFSLLFAGVFAFLAAMTRTPAVKLLPSANYFRVSIVAHVIFSLTVWFLAFMAALWSYSAYRDKRPISSRAKAGIWLAVIGMSLLAVASLFGLGEPLLIDYVPLLDHPIYLIGLFILSLGVTVAVGAYAAPIISSRERELDVVSHGMLVVGAIIIVAFLSVFLSAISLLASNHAAVLWGSSFQLSLIPVILSSSYRLLFWGPGHIIQFANTLAMMVVWLILLESALKSRVNEDLVKKLMLIGLAVALAMPLIYFLPLASQARFFTLGMVYGLGIPSVAITLLVLKAVWGSIKEVEFNELPWDNPAFSSLLLSIALFGVGGAIGLPGLGSNLRVPAHYHSSLGAVTIAFMGMTYLLLQLLNIKVYSERTARLQPYLYGLGLLVIILGLFWAGSYNAPRKAYGYEDPLTSLAMNIMGAGSVLAVVGGAAFVANTMLSLLLRKSSK